MDPRVHLWPRRTGINTRIGTGMLDKVWPVVYPVVNISVSKEPA